MSEGKEDHVDQFREGPGNQPGGIPESTVSLTTVEESSEGPSIKPGGISRSAIGSKGTKRKLTTKSYIEKYEAIIEVEKGLMTKKEIAAKFQIPQNTLSTWLKKKDDIKAKFLSGDLEPERKKARGAKFPEIEEALLKWIKNARSQNVAIDGETLKNKAREFADVLSISKSDFDCSSGWLERFKSRHGISYKKISGEANSVDRSDEAFTGWKSRLQTLLSQYNADDVFNADETAIFYRAMPDKTFEFKSVSCHGGKASKERLTVLVCANMSGTEKVPLLVIGKASKPRCFKNVNTLPTEYKANKKAWMTSQLFTEWVRKFDEQMSKKQRKVALVIDNCPAHPDIKHLKSVELIFLPPNTTSVTQPMDQGVIRNLKIHYRKLVIGRKIRAIDTGRDFSISVLDGMRILKHAWENVTPTTIANCYKHAGFTDENTEVNSDDDIDPDDDIPLSRLISIMGTKTSIDDYVNVDLEIPVCASVKDESIVEELISARSSEATDMSSDDDDITHEQPPVSLASAIESLENLRRFVEGCDNGHLMASAVESLDSFLTKKHLSSCLKKQTNILCFFKKQ